MLRAWSQAHKLELRRHARRSDRLLTRGSSSCSQLAATRGERMLSPWSDLLWRAPDAELDRILVALRNYS